MIEACEGARQGSTTLSVVIVTYRRQDLVLECVASVERALQAVAVPAEVIVVDNGSQDGTAEVIRSRFAWARVVEIQENAGFTPGVTAGIARARGEWIALLNDDVTIELDTLAVLLEAAKSNPSLGSVAAQMRFADRRNVINSAGIEVDRLGVATDRLLGAPIEASEHEPIEVFGASGGAALFRRQMLLDLGGFDDSFFAYLEDVDLAWRARMQGWRALYTPRAIAYHHHSATLLHGSNVKYYLVGRNRLRVLAKNATRRQLIRYGPLMLLYDLGYVVYVGATRRTLAPLRGRLRGLLEWRRYRHIDEASRQTIELRPPFGLRKALERNRAWARDGRA